MSFRPCDLPVVFEKAGVAELADASDLNSGGRKAVKNASVDR